MRRTSVLVAIFHKRRLGVGIQRQTAGGDFHKRVLRLELRHDRNGRLGQRFAFALGANGHQARRREISHGGDHTLRAGHRFHAVSFFDGFRLHQKRERLIAHRLDAGPTQGLLNRRRNDEHVLAKTQREIGHEEFLSTNLLPSMIQDCLRDKPFST